MDNDRCGWNNSCHCYRDRSFADRCGVIAALGILLFYPIMFTLAWLGL